MTGFEINTNDVIKTTKGFIYLCIGNGDDFNSSMMNIITEKTTPLQYVLRYDDVEEIRYTHQEITTTVLKYANEYKNKKELDINELWEQIKGCTKLVWSDELENMIHVVNRDDVVITNDGKFYFITMVSTFANESYDCFLMLEAGTTNHVEVIKPLSYDGDEKYNTTVFDINKIMRMKNENEDTIAAMHMLNDSNTTDEMRISIINNDDIFKTIYEA